MSYLLISEDEIMEVVFETSDPKEHSDKGEEDPVLNADLIKEGFELTSKLDNHFLNMMLMGKGLGSFNNSFSNFIETSEPQEDSPNFLQEITEKVSPMVQEDDNQDTSNEKSYTNVCVYCQK
ncbi:hypothetical protein CDAR_594481 [Caerostris darwini]|uniref:Uncharacterized protein n=1 Tax=Caerostris darwini TaxID=1538125 RepID=A0AAV4VTM3_9ARAC|nr:hypothetical protein CDAR_594481 [Caerostris darwini]